MKTAVYYINISITFFPLLQLLKLSLTLLISFSSNKVVWPRSKHFFIFPKVLKANVFAESYFKRSSGQGTSLVVQWLRIRLQMQGTRVRSLVGELRSHMPWSNYWACVPQLESLHAATTEPTCSGAHTLQLERSPHTTTKSPHATTNIPSAATKTQHSQINK